mgnify:CR=1 FL=1
MTKSQAYRIAAENAFNGDDVFKGINAPHSLLTEADEYFCPVFYFITPEREINCLVLLFMSEITK